jgi:predicted GNAT family acetyltransferase
MSPILESHNVTCWICERDRVVVGAGIGIRSDDIVGVYGMATPERFQRTGIGKTILRSMMWNYLDEGVTSFYLGATRAGLHLYEQLGYETVATPAALVLGASTQFH